MSKEMHPMSAETVETLYIDGAWVSASNGATRTVYCPADGSKVGIVSEATTQDTQRAIAAARRAFESGVWADRPAAERGDFLLEVADALRQRKDEFARAEALGTGQRLVEAGGEMDDLRRRLRHVGIVVDHSPGRRVGAGAAAVISRAVRGPVGVGGMTTPWNFALLQASWKTAPASAAGTSFGMNPAELNPHATM